MKQCNNVVNAVDAFFYDPMTHKNVPIGTSMSPFIENGQKVAIERNFSSLSVGCCYVFLLNNTLILHRLVAIFGSKAIFIGDNSQQFEVVSHHAIIGKLKEQQSYIQRLPFTLLNIIFLILWIVKIRSATTVRIRSYLFSCLLRKDKP